MDTVKTPDAAGSLGVLEACGAVWREHRLLLAYVAVYVACGFLVEKILAAEGMMRLTLYFEPLLLVTLGYLSLFLAGYVFLTWRRWKGGQSPFRWIRHDLATRYLYPLRIIRFLIIFLILPPFCSTFGSLKQAISTIKPFCWDHVLMQWDRRLHGGWHPWQLLQPVFGVPAITCLINLFYNLWFFVTFTVVVWQAWGEKPLVRMQFLWSFVITWSVLGSVMATLFSSAGPCYYHRITNQPDPYAPLIQYLRAVQDVYPVWALTAQERLWTAYQAGGTHLVGGISAMPSMHVATATLLALAGWRANRWLGIGLSAFAAIILIGSIHLCWHYAMDGYFSIPAALMIWWLCGWSVRRRGSSPTVRNR